MYGAAYNPSGDNLRYDSLQSEAYSSVQWNDNSPEFSDEIKVTLEFY